MGCVCLSISGLRRGERSQVACMYRSFTTQLFPKAQSSWQCSPRMVNYRLIVENQNVRSSVLVKQPKADFMYNLSQNIGYQHRSKRTDMAPLGALVATKSTTLLPVLRSIIGEKSTGIVEKCKLYLPFPDHLRLTHKWYLSICIAQLCQCPTLEVLQIWG